MLNSEDSCTVTVLLHAILPRRFPLESVTSSLSDMWYTRPNRPINLLYYPYAAKWRFSTIIVLGSLFLDTLSFVCVLKSLFVEVPLFSPPPSPVLNRTYTALQNSFHCLHIIFCWYCEESLCVPTAVFSLLSYIYKCHFGRCIFVFFKMFHFHFHFISYFFTM